MDFLNRDELFKIALELDLLNLEILMNTKSGKTEAKKRTRILKEFLTQLKQEISF